jgi:thioredoxin-dependent peroxiredoxin
LGDALGEARAAEKDPMLEVGAQAPSIPVPDQSGTLRSVGEFRGSWLVLWFYPKDFTGG